MIIEWNLDFPLESSVLSLMQIAADQTLHAEGIRFPCCATVRICKDDAIRALNNTYRGLDRATDVLSFPSVPWKAGTTARHHPERLRREYDEVLGACFLGDVVISWDHVLSQAKEYGHSNRRELAYLVTHSVLHLLGYDHLDEGPMKAQMREHEEAIMKRLDLER